jgi:hypothetical protein
MIKIISIFGSMYKKLLMCGIEGKELDVFGYLEAP